MKFQTPLLCLLVSSCLVACVDKEGNMEKARLHYDIAYDLLQKGEQGQAISQINTSIQLDPKNPTYHNLLGLIYMSRGMPSDAEKSFEKALDIKSDYADVRNNLCGLYINQGQWDKAIEQCQKALAIVTYASPEKAYLNMGWAYYKKTEFMKALEAYNQALLHRRDFYLAYQNRGMVHFDLGKYNLAIEDFKKAVNGCSFCPEPYYRLGLAFFKVDKKLNAKKSFEKCSELDKEGEIGGLCRNFLRGSSRTKSKS